MRYAAPAYHTQPRTAHSQTSQQPFSAQTKEGFQVLLSCLILQPMLTSDMMTRIQLRGPPAPRRRARSLHHDQPLLHRVSPATAYALATACPLSPYALATACPLSTYSTPCPLPCYACPLSFYVCPLPSYCTLAIYLRARSPLSPYALPIARPRSSYGFARMSRGFGIKKSCRNPREIRTNASYLPTNLTRKPLLSFDKSPLARSCSHASTGCQSQSVQPEGMA